MTECPFEQPHVSTPSWPTAQRSLCSKFSSVNGLFNAVGPQRSLAGQFGRVLNTNGRFLRRSEKPSPKQVHVQNGAIERLTGNERHCLVEGPTQPATVLPNSSIMSLRAWRSTLIFKTSTRNPASHPIDGVDRYWNARAAIDALRFECETNLSAKIPFDAPLDQTTAEATPCGRLDRRSAALLPNQLKKRPACFFTDLPSQGGSSSQTT
jgi:hypothetical protein